MSSSISQDSAAALRCCRNVVSIGRQGMLRFAVGMAIFLAACLVAQEAAAQVSGCRDRACAGQAHCAQLSEPVPTRDAASHCRLRTTVHAFEDRGEDPYRRGPGTAI